MDSHNKIIKQVADNVFSKIHLFFRKFQNYS